MAKEMTYEKAMEVLSTIMNDLENDKVSVDQLSDKVKEAQQLIQFCRNKLRGTEEVVLGMMDDKV